MKRRIHLQREAPHINGFPVPITELELPETMLDPSKRESWNNHHRHFYARIMARLTMTQLLRDLDANQDPTPRDIHNIYHDRYTPPPVPALVDVMDRLDEARQKQEPLRYGTISFPTFQLISDDQWADAQNEYNLLNR